MSSSKDRERDRAPEPHDPNWARDTYNYVRSTWTDAERAQEDRQKQKQTLKEAGVYNKDKHYKPGWKWDEHAKMWTPPTKSIFYDEPVDKDYYDVYMDEYLNVLDEARQQRKVPVDPRLAQSKRAWEKERAKEDAQFVPPPSDAQQVLNEWMAWRNKMMDAKDAENERKDTEEDRQKWLKQRNRPRSQPTTDRDHIPTAAETALHSTRHDAADEFGENVANETRQRENKTAQPMWVSGGRYTPGRPTFAGPRRAQDKPIGTEEYEEMYISNPGSGRRYHYNWKSGPTPTSARVQASRETRTLVDDE